MGQITISDRKLPCFPIDYHMQSDATFCMWKSIGKQGSFLSEIIICPIDIGDLVGNFVFGNGTYYFAGPSPGQSLCPSLLPLPNFSPQFVPIFCPIFQNRANRGG
jgi:hypothetical protein